MATLRKDVARVSGNPLDNLGATECRHRVTQHEREMLSVYACTRFMPSSLCRKHLINRVF